MIQPSLHPGPVTAACESRRRWSFGLTARSIGLLILGFIWLIPGFWDDRLSYGGLTLWEVAGEPVAMAGRTRDVAGVGRVAPVYTPPAQRQRGYGAAVTTAVTQSALDAGAAAVVLFTDQANPTSNALYQRLGYRPVEDRVLLNLHQPG